MEITNEPRQGRPRVINKDLINTVRTLTKESECTTVAETEQYLRGTACDPLLRGTVVEII